MSTSSLPESPGSKPAPVHARLHERRNKVLVILAHAKEGLVKPRADQSQETGQRTPKRRDKTRFA